MSNPDIYRRVRLHFDKDMYPLSPSSTSPEACTIRALGVWPARDVVPVVFIPGIMGSNLQSKEKKTAAWVPPNSVIESLEEVGRRINQEPKDRQTQLTADDCEVYDYGDAVKIPKDYLALDPDEAKRRHWGEVHADSYLDILRTLEEQLNYPFQGVEGDYPKPDKDWGYAMSPKKQRWTPKSPLSEEEFRNRMGQLYFPVYACGYNWLQSNEQSAQRVIERIEEIEKRLAGHKYYRYTGKVLLVTHSMGGLVGRRVAQRLGDKIVGVVHSVQPVTGAPAVYRRFKGGTETKGFLDIPGAGAAVVLGWGAHDITCVLGNSPGPMELLPTKDYPPGWLHITDGDKTVRLPKADPYEEIYRVSAEDKWWGMVDPGLLDPAEKLKDKGNLSPRTYFLTQLKVAEKFHDTLKLTCHPNTYAHFGDDPGQTSLAKVAWHTVQDITSLSDEALLNAKRVYCKMTGRTDVEIDGRRISFDLAVKRDPGDGTVPTPSGEAALKLEGIRDAFRLDGFDHQSSVDNDHARHTMLYAVAKIVQDIPLATEGEVSCDDSSTSCSPVCS
jgi:pimeloyl-ACP methyl ester carboxylesterase